MKYIFLITLFISSLFATQMGWQNNYKAALKEAKIEKKDVYMLITSSDCRWCRKFESTTLQEKVVIERLKEQYVLLHVDRDDDFIPADFKRKRVPRHYFITNRGEIIYSFLGYWDREDFFSFLADVDEKR